MIITRTPFRISFFGGGTDLPAWYKDHGGEVINVSINKYSYLNMRYLPPYFDYNFRLRYYIKEEVKKISQIKHNSFRACLDYCNFHNKKIDITHTADLPAQSGLGSSSTFTVGLLKTLSSLKSDLISKRYLAKTAINIEQKILKENVGVQDQIAASFGGFNNIQIDTKGNFVINPIIHDKNIKAIEESCLLVFTGLQRNADPIEKKKIENIKSKESILALNEITQICVEAKKFLYSNNFHIKEWGNLLNEHWLMKKKLSNKISNLKIDNIYNEAIKLGAYGGKLMGAGNGGFLLLLCSKKAKKEISKKLNKIVIPNIKFDSLGAQVIYYFPDEIY